MQVREAAPRPDCAVWPTVADLSSVWATRLQRFVRVAHTDKTFRKPADMSVIEATPALPGASGLLDAEPGQAHHEHDAVGGVIGGPVTAAVADRQVPEEVGGRVGDHLVEQAAHFQV